MSDGYSIANMQLPSGTTKIKLLRSVVIEGIQGAEVGKVYEVSHGTARTLVNMGAAEMVTVDDSTPAPSSAVETRDPVVEARDPEVQTEKPPGKSAPRKPPKSA